MSGSESSLFGEALYAYTRAQALADGVLVDVPDLAREAGFVFPVALTERLYHGYIVPTIALVAEGQSIAGRLWDLLTVLRWTIQTSKDDSNLPFSVLFIMSSGSPPVAVHLVAVCGPGDNGEPVVTVMLPDED